MSQRLLLHLGLHKTATTYLQKYVWPAWQAVGYAGRPDPPGFSSSEQAVFSRSEDVILMSNESAGGSLKQSYLKGRSWAAFQQKKLEDLKSLYAGKYDIAVLLGLRHPQPWVLSIYKHYLKYGGVETFEGFLGLEPGTPATLDLDDLRVMPKIRRIEEALGATPCCFFTEEIRHAPDGLSAALAACAGVDSGPSFPTGATPNEGVNESEAAICLKINRTLFNRGCLGKGWLKRNKSKAFTLARKFAASRKDAAPLRASDHAKAHLTESLGEDHQAVIDLIASQRGMAAEDFRRAAGFAAL